jgi:hypothetical protein
MIDLPEGFDEWLEQKGGKDALDAEQLQIAKQIGLTMEEAMKIASEHSDEEVLAMARRRWEKPESRTDYETRIILAHNLVRIGSSRAN